MGIAAIVQSVIELLGLILPLLERPRDNPTADQQAALANTMAALAQAKLHLAQASHS